MGRPLAVLYIRHEAGKEESTPNTTNNPCAIHAKIDHARQRLGRSPTLNSPKETKALRQIADLAQFPRFLLSCDTEQEILSQYMYRCQTGGQRSQFLLILVV